MSRTSLYAISSICPVGADGGHVRNDRQGVDLPGITCGTPLRSLGPDERSRQPSGGSFLSGVEKARVDQAAMEGENLLAPLAAIVAAFA